MSLPFFLAIFLILCFKYFQHTPLYSSLLTHTTTICFSFLCRIWYFQCHSLSKPWSVRIRVDESVHKELFCFFLQQFPTPSNPFWLTAPRAETSVFVKASTSLVFGFSPVMPTYMFDTLVHVCVGKDHPSKGSPWSPEIWIRRPSIAGNDTP